MRSVAAAILLCRCIAAQVPASIEGSVIDATTKQPLPGVHISMVTTRGVMAPAAAPNSRPSLYGAVSKADGHFSITGLPAASYFLTPDRTGYVFVSDKPGVLGMQQTVALKPGENKTGFTISMTPRAVIMGRVTDESGDPVQNVRIQAVLQSGSGARAMLGPMFASTDDRGEFRLHGPPGKYLVSADAPQSQRYPQGVKEVRTDGSQPMAYSTTWYPSADRKDHATAIDAVSGRDTTGIEIRLISRRSVSISGVVTGFSVGNTMPMIRIWSAEREDGQQTGNNMRMSAINRDGKFEASGLAPGRYRLQAQYFGPVDSNGVNMQSQVADVDAETGETGGIQLALVPGGELSGIVEFAGPASKAKRTVNLEIVSGAEQRFNQGAASAVGEDGSFHIKSIFPGKYSVKVNPMPEGAYLKTVKLDNADQSDGVIDLTHWSGSSKVKVTLSLNAATITGSVVNQKDEPSEDPFAFVLLMKSREDAGRDMARVEASGTYTFSGVAPGKYRLLAVGLSVLSGGGLEDLKPFFDKAEVVEIHEGDRITRNAKLLESH